MLENRVGEVGNHTVVGQLDEDTFTTLEGDRYKAEWNERLSVLNAVFGPNAWLHPAKDEE